MRNIKLFLAGTLALLIGCSSAPISQDIPDRVIQWSEANVWKIGSRGGTGSAFAINDKTVITACHVVRGLKGTDQLIYMVNDRDPRLVFVSVKSCNTETDVAVLERTHGDELNSLPTSFHPPTRRGKVIWGAGHPLGMELVVTRGHLQFEIDDQRAQGKWLITSPTIMGDSGSPVLGIYDNQVMVLGIRTAIRVVPVGMGMMRMPNVVPHLTLMAPTGAILDELHQNVEGY